MPSALTSGPENRVWTLTSSRPHSRRIVPRARLLPAPSCEAMRSSVLIVAVAMIIYIAGLTLAARSERSSDESKSGANPGVRLMLVLPVLFPLLALKR